MLPAKRVAATREKSLIFFMVVKILEFVIRVYLEFVMIAENLHVGYHPKMKMRSYGVKKKMCSYDVYGVKEPTEILLQRYGKKIIG